MSWKMKDGTILRGYDALGNKRPEPSKFPWLGVCAFGALMVAIALEMLL